MDFVRVGHSHKSHSHKSHSHATVTHTDAQTQTQTRTATDRHTDTDTDTQTQIQTQIQTQTQRTDTAHRHTATHTHTATTCHALSAGGGLLLFVGELWHAGVDGRDALLSRSHLRFQTCGVRPGASGLGLSISHRLQRQADTQTHTTRKHSVEQPIAAEASPGTTPRTAT